MIVAQIRFKGTWMNVQVLDLFMGSRGKVVLVKSIPKNGRVFQPFCQWTHGGWVYSDTTTIPIARLHNARSISNKKEN